MKKSLHKKSGLVGLLFLIFLSALFAGEPLVTSDQVNSYVIKGYEFSVQGKTKDFALRSVVVPPDGDPIFLSEEAMVEALAAKKQLLVNKRIFTKVEFTYALDSYSKGTAYYIATFYVEDASTFLTIPYPKFDNDTIGLRLGVKMYDKNLLGSFSDLYISGNISQGDGGRNGWDNRQDAFEMKISSLPMGKSFLDISFNYEQTKGSPNAGTFNFSFDWNNLEIKGSKLSIAPWGKFNPASDFSSWNPDEYGVAWRLGPFKQNESTFSLYNQVKRYEDLKKIYTLTYLDQHELTFFSHPISFRISTESDAVIGSEVLSYMNVGATLGTGFSLPLGLTWSSSVGAILHYNLTDIPVPYSYLLSNTLSKSNVNWQGNFRKGVQFSLDYITDLYPQDEYWKSKSTWYVATNLSWFPLATERFNPSVQFRGFVADEKKRAHFENSTIADYMRGYLTNTLEKLDLGAAREYGAVINLNLTTKFINFGFAKSYASPFIDIALFQNVDNPDKPIIISSAGLDGWAILNKFPSYPVRASLGFNLQDVRKAIDNEKDIIDIEWELTIGMGLFF
ncbi:MAG TPA: hypothetical protein DCG32_01325 [Sphaerochaeta sp.]|nr:hypothetical protein [Sphaerochaeta sp.]